MELIRIAYMPQHTLGWLVHKDQRWATIERPWIPSQLHRGGLNAKSCVPDGEYKLTRYYGMRFPDSIALESPELDVRVVAKEGIPSRSAILIHVGNFVEDVIGCIAPGLRHGIIGKRQAVTSSGVAMKQIRDALANAPLPGLVIRPSLGTSEPVYLDRS